jgi:hypothetical protein
VALLSLLAEEFDHLKASIDLYRNFQLMPMPRLAGYRSRVCCASLRLCLWTGLRNATSSSTWVSFLGIGRARTFPPFFHLFSGRVFQDDCWSRLMSFDCYHPVFFHPELTGGIMATSSPSCITTPSSLSSSGISTYSKFTVIRQLSSKFALMPPYFSSRVLNNFAIGRGAGRYSELFEV